MKFLLEVDVSSDRLTENTARELGRILRYWAGNLHHYPLRPGDGSAVYDSGYEEVGQWRMVGPAEE
ncbi:MULTISPECIES: hypothetical protein [Streptomyces]|uniref:Uncharacterized protein n=2 Tax=Streptomyces TaxID=1883 RepID=A0A3R7HB13_9ACTN|nr:MULTISPECIES: hypothetical protein [Streptomyces]KNE82666.1 hypothetical protein ADZ36_09560 [Streptomyces fradiae]OFA52350.1 hypothetical protein BEN35_11830 [Streptomyces fradiae]PQM21018.1 hypothetical protein Sfr7A_23530 [Streptomyces xinghaiensis]RKM92872.1 hypothetical protein SFRA_023480 [Streptomyces xinghaiensis]RNC72460.1 hypothetical protein DC095_018970 [Streptomyces xinghaiensis]